MKWIFKIGLLVFLYLVVLSCRGHQIESITMDRTPCYGTCPWYSLTLYKDGKVIYTAKKFVENIGVYQAQISKEQTKKIFSAFEKEKFQDFKDNYPIEIYDLPGFNFEFTMKKGKIKKIQNANFGPEILLHLSKMMDKELLPLKWEKIAEYDENK